MKKLYFFALLLISFFGNAQTYHSLSTSSFTQNWSNTGLITTSDDWSGVTSIRGFRGDGLTGGTAVDPRTVLAADNTGVLDVNANQTNPNTNTTGGVTEFEITNPVVAFQGSGTARAPYLKIYLNTTGVSNIRVRYLLRDVDGGGDNSVQPVALQYRIGNSGDFINVDAGYVADASSGPNDGTKETAVDVTLPADANNQAQLEIRIITTDAVGSDEWIGIDDINISASTPGGDVTAPTATTLTPANNATNVPINTTATIVFSETIKKGTGNILVKKLSDNSVVQTIDVASNNVTVTGSQASFALTLANSTDYYIEVAAGAFTDEANNAFAGITGATTWKFTTVAPPAGGVLSKTYNFNDCPNYINDGFKTYSVTGAQTWQCTKFGRTYTTDPSTDSAIEMNGYTNAAQANEDWLISPKFDLSGTNIPLLDFYSRTKFSGQQLTLRVSTNYSGSGDPTTATWTTLSGEFPTTDSDVWKLSDSINLSAFKNNNVHIAWVYKSNTSEASRWSLDDITIYTSTVAPVAYLAVTGSLLDFREGEMGNASEWKAITYEASNLSTNLTVTAPTGFLVSKDGTNYSASITFSVAETLNGRDSVYVVFNPSASNTVYSGYLQFSSTGVSNSQVFVKGNSYDVSTTLNVATWNIEWFGSTGSGQGPTDDNLAQANAKKVLDYLGADVIAAVEIVDATRFGNLVNSLAGGYSYVLSDFCSNGATATACTSAQKLGLIYKTSVLSNVTARPLLKGSTTASSNWSTGRLPYLINADVTKGGKTANINFIVIHGKANTGNTAEQIESYNRRKAGAQELKDTLDTHFANANIIILGDFNDDLDRTIAPTTGADVVSSYQPIVADSTDANHYKSPTLLLSNFNLSSTATNPEMIDHIVVSNELGQLYINLSATLYNDIDSLVSITDYSNTTSDHYPVMARFNMANISTGLEPVLPAAVELKILPNPVTTTLNFSFKSQAGKMSYQLLDINGRLIWQTNAEAVYTGKMTKSVNAATLPSGSYILRIINNNNVITQKFIKQ